jgi:2-dehydropantoate 2-reductase
MHILGIGNLGKFCAHAIRKSDPALAVILLFHRENLREDWTACGKGIEVVTDGVSNTRSGFGVEIMTPDAKEPLTSCITHLIVASKSYNTTAALRLVRHRLSESSTVLFLQNGMGKCLNSLTKIIHDWLSYVHGKLSGSH